MKKIRFAFLSLTLALLSACGEPTEPEIAFGRAAVAMPDAFAAAAAMDVLEKGGNAVDAAVAAGFVLAVTEPEAGNIGGGGFLLNVMNGEASFVDYREVAPLAAHRDMYLDENGDVDLQASRVGHRAVGVPGAVAGYWAVHERYGTRPWKDLVEYSVRYARDGFKVHENLVRMVEFGGRKFEGKTNFDQYFSKLEAGQVFKQPELAATLQRIADQGPDGFYKGETADFIVAEMERGGGLISHEDLERYEAVWREPLRTDWREFELLSSPPPSSGGFAVIQLLKIKDLLAHEFEGLPHNSPQYVHLVAEMEKRVFADRAEYLGDPDYYDVPMDKLLSDDYLASRAREISPNVISKLEDVDPGLESWETTHFSVVDAYGNAVSNTTTLNLGFGSGVVVEGAGFLLNDEMDDFSAKPGVPNAFGVIGRVANEIQPGKRMLSSMSPTILLKDGEVELVVGTPGGSTIFTTVFQMIVNVYDFDMTPLESAGASRFHHQLLNPALVTFSPSVPLSDETISKLADRGYEAVPHPYDYGDVQLIVREDEGYTAAADPRKRGESLLME